MEENNSLRMQEKFLKGSMNTPLMLKCDQVTEEKVVLFFACSFKKFTSKEAFVNTNTFSF